MLLVDVLQVHVLQDHVLQVHVLQVHVLQVHILQVHVLQVQSSPVHSLQVQTFKGNFPVKGKMAEMVLRNVLHVPSYKVNLLSVDTAVSFGHRFIFHDSHASKNVG